LPDTDIKRIARLTDIVTQLQSGKIITAAKLSEKYSLSLRTIYRDIRTLEQSGIPVITEEGKGYRIMDGYRIPPIMFTDEEANAILTVELIVQSSKDVSLIKKFTEATAKIRAVLPGRIKAKTEKLERQMGVTNTYIDKAAKSNYLLEIQKALVDLHLINVDYTNQQGVPSTRSLEPFAVYANQLNEWVLIAFCRLRQEYRSFALLNIRKVVTTNEKFAPHTMTLEQFLEKKYQNKKAK
jgi:predicted DNA-binding transcriptional regulator YafY